MMNRLAASLLLLVPLAMLLVSCSGKPQRPASPRTSLWRGQRYDGRYAITVDQPRALLDTPLAIQVTGLQAGQPVTLSARATSRSGQVMESSATSVADASGVVDVGTAQPLYGSYDQVDAMGLFWSMLPVTEIEPDAASGALSLLPVILVARAEDKVLATTQIEWLFVLDESKVAHQSIDQEGLVGALFYPVGPERHPGVIWLGGSEGGLSEGYAALLASYGYAALAYFGVDPLPDELVQIPLEYCAQAIAWLKAQPFCP